MPKLKRILTGSLLTLGVLGAGSATAFATPVKPVPGHMIGGSVSCKPVAQTLTWWVNVTDKTGFTTATENGVALPANSTSGSFVVHGPETVSFVLDNHVKGVVLESTNTVVVPDASVCVVTPPTNMIPPVTTTTPPPATTVPPVTTTTPPPVVTTVPRPPVTIRPLPPVLVPPATTPPVAKVVPTPQPTPVQVAPAVSTTPTALAETGAPSDIAKIALLGFALLIFGYGIERKTRKPKGVK